MKTLFTTLLLINTFSLFSQTPIDVTDRTIKIGGMDEEEMFFGFAEGDQIVFNFQEVDGKEMKEVEIIEYPNSSKFSEYKTSKIENKAISVNTKSVYKFRFYNGAVSGRICKIKIQRIPKDVSTSAFNTNVTWVTKQDTTWNTYTKDVVVGHDTTYRQITKKELVKTEVREEVLLDKSQRVHTEMNENGNKSYVSFSLPQSKIEDYKTSKVISWAYWVGVGQEASYAWQQNTESIVGLAEGIASIYTTPLGALAVGAVVGLILPQNGDDVYYAMTDRSNAELFFAGQGYQLWDKGTGIAGYKKFTDAGMCKGTYYVVLSNDNIMDAIDVTVKVIAMVETSVYEDKQYTEETVKPILEKKIFSDPVIKSEVVPVIGA